MAEKCPACGADCGPGKGDWSCGSWLNRSGKHDFIQSVECRIAELEAENAALAQWRHDIEASVLAVNAIVAVDRNRAEKAEQSINRAETAAGHLEADVVELKTENARLRGVCAEAASTLNEILDRHDDELQGSAAGDVDNVRLDLLLASEGKP